jgi:alanyl-tRNA synthetase
MIKYRQVADKKSTYAHIVLDRTPFYAEAGGQVGDTGFLTKGEETLRVWDTKTENDQIIHVCDRLPEAPAGRWHAQIDVERREQIKLNHTATHLLHEALRRVVGEHVEQRGSLVAPDYLRFDFSHFSKLSDEELQEVERRVNDKIAAAIPREEIRDVPIDEAKAMGATALFGEKYGERVRVIRFGADYSTELCGGTHAPNTQDIRYFHIRSEAAVASGIRRIEAVTGERALNQLEQQAGLLNEIKTLLKNPKDIRGAIEQLQEQNKTLKKQLEAARGAALKQIRAELLANARQAKGYQYITQRVAVESGEELKQLAFDLRNNAGTSTIAVLGTILKGKPQLNVVLTDDLADNEQLQANALIKPIAQQIQGGGGGQAIYASAGGKNPEGLDQALQEAERRIRATVEATEA